MYWSHKVRTLFLVLYEYPMYCKMYGIGNCAILKKTYLRKIYGKSLFIYLVRFWCDSPFSQFKWNLLRVRIALHCAFICFRFSAPFWWQNCNLNIGNLGASNLIFCSTTHGQKYYFKYFKYYCWYELFEKSSILFQVLLGSKRRQ